MTSLLRVSVVALVASAASLAAVASAGADTAPPNAPKAMQSWMSDREAMLDARIAGLKAGLRLTPDQDKLWGPFEAALRDFANARMARMKAMIEREAKDGDADKADDASPLDRLDRVGTRLSEVGASLKKIADTGKPLYASLDDQQKRMFGFLSHQMMKMGRHGMGMDMMKGGRHHGRDQADDEDNSDDSTDSNDDN